LDIKHLTNIRKCCMGLWSFKQVET